VKCNIQFLGERHIDVRQACTADLEGEVDFLVVIHCVTADDDFGFATKDFVKTIAA